LVERRIATCCFPNWTGLAAELEAASPANLYRFGASLPTTRSRGKAGLRFQKCRYPDTAPADFLQLRIAPAMRSANRKERQAKALRQTDPSHRVAAFVDRTSNLNARTHSAGFENKPPVAIAPSAKTSKALRRGNFFITS